MTPDEKYLFNDLYDEVVEGLEKEEQSSLRPLCDSLKSNKSRYSDFEEIALGGMKVIYKVFDHKVNRFIAYAALHNDCPHELHDHFIREARLTALLEHPNIINVYNIGLDEESKPFFTMELKVGQSQIEMIKETSKGTDFNGFRLLLEGFLKICDAISYAHSKNVLHLDLKPENIQVGSFGEVIVCDWGLGKIIGDKNQEYDHLLFNPDLLNNVTLTDRVVGTPGYMAPEQVHKDGEKTKLTDIYSLGGILYTILTGKCAFEGSVDDILENTINGSFQEPRARKVEWEVPASLNAVVMKAMSLEPANRYQSVEQLRGEVQDYLLGKTTQAENAGLFKEARLFYKRNFLICNVVLFFIVSLFLSGGIFLLELQSKNKHLSEEKTKTQKSFEAAEREKLRFKNALDKMFMEKGLATGLLREEYSRLKESFDLVDSRVFEDPVGALGKAEKLLLSIPENSPAYEWSRMQVTYIYYLRQQFHFYEKFYFVLEHESLLSDKVSQIAALKDVDELSPLAQLKELMKIHIRFPYSLGTVLKMLKYDGVMRESKQEHSELVEVILRGINEQWQGKFNYDFSSQKLVLNGDRLFRIALTPSKLSMRGQASFLRVSLVNSLPIKILDVSGTELLHFETLIDLNLEELVIKDVNLKDLSAIQEMKSLRRLTVSRGHFSTVELAKLPKTIELIQE
ncbi:MAG: serine/threonine protein kinase [Lentisphaeraceae bacterium]|nr:serine/threonine protein kinase [Lentisphaeraceae bacterium]